MEIIVQFLFHVKYIGNHCFQENYVKSFTFYSSLYGISIKAWSRQEPGDALMNSVTSR